MSLATVECHHSLVEHKRNLTHYQQRHSHRCPGYPRMVYCTTNLWRFYATIVRHHSLVVRRGRHFARRHHRKSHRLYHFPITVQTKKRYWYSAKAPHHPSL